MGKGYQEEVTFGCDRVWAGGVVGAGPGGWHKHEKGKRGTFWGRGGRKRLRALMPG